MNEIIEWTTANWESLVAGVGGVVIAARIIVKLTPTPKDDRVLAKIIALLKHLGLYIPVIALVLALPGCGTLNSLMIDPDGCLGVTVERDGQRYTVATCPDDTRKIQWSNPEGVDFRAILPQGHGDWVIEYGNADAGEWLQWGAKAAVDPGTIPSEISAD